jgi:hypothetical protein
MAVNPSEECPVRAAADIIPTAAYPPLIWTPSPAEQKRRVYIVGS